jgi:hypothetical protein
MAVAVLQHSLLGVGTADPPGVPGDTGTDRLERSDFLGACNAQQLASVSEPLLMT